MATSVLMLLLVTLAPQCIVALTHAVDSQQQLSTSQFGFQERNVKDFQFDSIDLLAGLANLTDIEKRALVCPAGSMPCSDGIHCAAPGGFCCPGDNAHGCDIGGTCCQGSGGCAKAGYYCCADGSGSCLDGSSCCPGNNKCARVGETCCYTGVCSAGQTCCSNGVGCADPGWSCCGSKSQCAPRMKCCVDEDGDHYCAKSCVPSLIIPYLELEDFLDEIFENMCKGTLASSTTTDPNSAILTLRRETGKDLQRLKNRARRAAGCGGKLRCLPGSNCDEFPFASTVEGGSGATIKCVPKEQNLWQSSYMTSWQSEQLKLGTLVRGGQYRVVLKNIDCSKFLHRRLDKRAGEYGILQQSDNTTLLAASLFGNHSSQNALFIDLTKDQDTPGTYTLDYELSRGSIASGAIVDDDGEYLTSVDALTTGNKGALSVNLEEDHGDVYFLGWTDDKDVQVSHEVKVVPSTSTTPSASYSSSTTSSSGTATTARTTPSASAASSGAAMRASSWRTGGMSSVLLALAVYLA